jgi:hypothetical protein
MTGFWTNLRPINGLGELKFFVGLSFSPKAPKPESVTIDLTPYLQGFD